MIGDRRLPQQERPRGLLPKARASIPTQGVYFFDRVDLWLSTDRSIDGLWVGSIEDEPWPGLSRVESALRLIRDRDPLHYSRVLRYLDRIWVRLISSGRAEYQRRLNACVLDQRYVLSETMTVENLASIIIHETTHARLERWGITYEEKARPRIEAICIRRQLNFGAKLPDGEALREQLSASLEWCLSDHDYFADTRFQERNLQGDIDTLRYLGVSEWIVRVVLKLREWRSVVRAHSLK